MRLEFVKILLNGSSRSAQRLLLLSNWAAGKRLIRYVIKRYCLPNLFSSVIAVNTEKRANIRATSGNGNEKCTYNDERVATEADLAIIRLLFSIAKQ